MKSIVPVTLDDPPSLYELVKVNAPVAGLNEVNAQPEPSLAQVS